MLLSLGFIMKTRYLFLLSTIIIISCSDDEGAIAILESESDSVTTGNPVQFDASNSSFNTLNWSVDNSDFSECKDIEFCTFTFGNPGNYTVKIEVSKTTDSGLNFFPTITEPLGNSLGANSDTKDEDALQIQVTSELVDENGTAGNDAITTDSSGSDTSSSSTGSTTSATTSSTTISSGTSSTTTTPSSTTSATTSSTTSVAATPTITTDTTAPTVVSVSPINGSTDVAKSTSISVTFSESMNTSTISTLTSGTSCSGSIQVSLNDFSSCVTMLTPPISSINDTMFTVIPSSDLSSLSTYKIKITTLVTDKSLNYLSVVYVTSSGFTISDTIAPTVVSVSPVNGSTDVAKSTSISVTFSESMNTSTISTLTSGTSCSGSIQVSLNDFSSCVTMSTSPNASNTDKTFTIMPSAALVLNTTYKIKVTNNAADTVGNLLASEYIQASGFQISSGTQMGGAIQGGNTAFTGIVTTPYGPPQGFSTSGDIDATGNAALFYTLMAVTTDGINLYVADQGNNKIRKIVISTGVVTTIAGPSQGSTVFGDIDATGSSARFYNPRGITTDGTNLYVTDNSNNKIRKIVISTGAVTTIAGPAPGSTASGDTDATGNAARFWGPDHITTDGNNLYVTDWNNNKIRKIVIATGVVTTIAGPTQGLTTSGDTDGTGNASRFDKPAGITTDGINLYVTDYNNNKIRKIVIATGVVTTIAGPIQGSITSGDADGTGNVARFTNPYDMTTDGINLYIAGFVNNKVRKLVISTGVVTTLAGPDPGSTASGDTDGTGNLARFSFPKGITTDGISLYVSTNNHKIRRIQ
ncbi:MAG: Ig-like domain-containing protein [SAR324 cluster bacterium]|nr:Ig-like domain-containing protein [SAR324 cluster bacterium]